jgi:hypothetical protein
MNDDALLTEINRSLAFQVKWRRVMSGMYFTSTALAILCSAAATVTAGMNKTVWASILAGSATSLFGLEKALLLREKWAHHVSIAVQLDALKLAYVYSNIGREEAAKRMGNILTEYAVKLPTAPRTERD